MGVLLDTTVLISAERTGLNPYGMMEKVLSTVGSQPIVISAIGYTEVVHGVHRANTPARYATRTHFLRIIKAEIPIMAYTEDVAEIAGRLSAQSSSTGWNIPQIDLLIAATALSVNYSVLTANVKHFRLVPDLNVIEF